MLRYNNVIINVVAIICSGLIEKSGRFNIKKWMPEFEQLDTFFKLMFVTGIDKTECF